MEVSLKTSKRSKSTINAVCHRITYGLSLNKACNAVGCDPGNFIHWLNESRDSLGEYARQRYARATAVRRELKFERLDDIAEVATPRDAHVARLKIDVIKWQLSKEDPKKYGDRPNEINVNTQINLAVITPEDQARLQARRLELLGEDVSSKVRSDPTP
jgi:hypothetical protein